VAVVAVVPSLTQSLQLFLQLVTRLQLALVALAVQVRVVHTVQVALAEHHHSVHFCQSQAADQAETARLAATLLQVEAATLVAVVVVQTLLTA
jgi:hypothetical protein